MWGDFPPKKKGSTAGRLPIFFEKTKTDKKVI